MAKQFPFEIKLFSSLDVCAHLLLLLLFLFFMMWNLFLWHHLYSDEAIVSGKCYQFLHRTQQHSNSTINASWNKDFFFLDSFFLCVCVFSGWSFICREGIVQTFFFIYVNFWNFFNNKNSFLLILKREKKMFIHFQKYPQNFFWCGFFLFHRIGIFLHSF